MIEDADGNEVAVVTIPDPDQAADMANWLVFVVDRHTDREIE